MSVIITLGKNISIGDTMFNDGVIKTDLVKIAHLLKHLPGRIIMGQFERFFHGGSL